MKQKVQAYLCLGSNMGSRLANLEKALSLLSGRVVVKKLSQVYETDPVGDTDQPRFLNLVCEIETSIRPEGLLVLAKGIEAKLGRVPARRNGPRPIDIDILFYNDEVIDTPELVIPHPRLAERAFVLVPLADIAPDKVHPILGKTVRQMLEALTEKQGVFRWDSSEEKQDV